MGRKLFLSIGILFLVSVSRASVFDLWTTSHTQTADTYQVISASPCVLNAVCINRASATGGQLTIFNSGRSIIAGVNVDTITILDATNKGICSPYNTYLSSGLTYNSTGTIPADVNIQWSKWNH